MRPTLALLALLLVSPLALADNGLHFDMINLQASASADVDNDELITQLQVFEEGPDPARLTSTVNKRTALVLDAINHFDAIRAKTSGYSTRPVYHKGEITHWQVSQQLTLETNDFAQMSRLVADIDRLATIQSMRFQLSREKAESVQAELTEQAIASFKNKAALIARQLDRDGYRLVTLHINSDPGGPMPVMERAMVMSADMGGSGVPAALSAGSNEVSVQLNGSIQLDPAGQAR